MRNLIGLIAFAFALAVSAAHAQIAIPNIDALLARLTATHAAAATTAEATTQRPPVGLLAANVVESSPTAANPPSISTASWVYLTPSVCIAGLATAGTEYTAIIHTNSYVFITASTYGAAVVAANCASGRTVAYYADSAGTVYDVASYAR